jgi:hypothetical protein
MVAAAWVAAAFLSSGASPQAIRGRKKIASRHTGNKVHFFITATPFIGDVET